MKVNYEAPQIEVIEIELEGVLCQSNETKKVKIQTFHDGGVA